MTKSELVAVRDMVEGDRNFILATWLRGLRYGNDFFNAISSEVYFKEYQAILEKLLYSPHNKVTIACLRDEPDVILGYSVGYKDSPILHWVFVKQAWRKIGIAKSLLPTDLKYVTHATKLGLEIIKKHPEVVYNPFLF